MTTKPPAPRSLARIYLWTFAAVLLPCWLGQALIQQRLPASLAGASGIDALALVGLLLIAAGCLCGVGVGPWLLGRRRYAVIGAAGRSALIALAALLERLLRTDPPGHPYLVAIGGLGVMLWVLADLVWIWRAFRRREPAMR